MSSFPFPVARNISPGQCAAIYHGVQHSPASPLLALFSLDRLLDDPGIPRRDWVCYELQSTPSTVFGIGELCKSTSCAPRYYDGTPCMCPTDWKASWTAGQCQTPKTPTKRLEAMGSYHITGLPWISQQLVGSACTALDRYGQ